MQDLSGEEVYLKVRRAGRRDYESVGERTFGRCVTVAFKASMSGLAIARCAISFASGATESSEIRLGFCLSIPATAGSSVAATASRGVRDAAASFRPFSLLGGGRSVGGASPFARSLNCQSS